MGVSSKEIMQFVTIAVRGLLMFALPYTYVRLRKVMIMLEGLQRVGNGNAASIPSFHKLIMGTCLSVISCYHYHSHYISNDHPQNYYAFIFIKHDDLTIPVQSLTSIWQWHGQISLAPENMTQWHLVHLVVRYHKHILCWCYLSTCSNCFYTAMEAKLVKRGDMSRWQN